MCLPFLRKHIELAQPKALLLLGATPARALMGSTDSITRLRGRWADVEVGGKTVPAIATFQPSRLIKQPHHKGNAWRDLLSVQEKLASLDG